MSKIIKNTKEKYNKIDEKYKETFRYIIVGGLTTFVSIGSYYLIRLILSDVTICTIFSWICAVLFAYIANRLFVFKSKNKKYIKEITSFVGSRIFSLLVEIVVMLILTSLFKMNDKIAKILVQFIILVLNYLTSKLFVFKKEK